MLPPELKLQLPQLGVLFANGPRIRESTLNQILAFPQAKLKPDLYEIVRYAYQTEPVYMEDLKAGTITTDDTAFIFHAIQLLAELRAEEELQDIGHFLGRDWGSYMFWFGHMRSFWAKDPLYLLGRNRLDVLKELILATSAHLFPKASAVMAVSKVCLVNPLRKQEVVDLYLEIVEELHKWTNKLYQTEQEPQLALLTSVLPVITAESTRIKAPEVIDRVIQMIDETGREPGLTVSELETQKVGIDIATPPVREDIPDIVARYHAVNDYLDEPPAPQPAPLAPFTDKYKRLNRGPIRKGKQTGRNEPCPCGSGKKYKKCCGK